jgi:hypothetical protein
MKGDRMIALIVITYLILAVLGSITPLLITENVRDVVAKK